MVSGNRVEKHMDLGLEVHGRMAVSVDRDSSMAGSGCNRGLGMSW